MVGPPLGSADEAQFANPHSSARKTQKNLRINRSHCSAHVDVVKLKLCPKSQKASGPGTTGFAPYLIGESLVVPARIGFRQIPGGSCRRGLTANGGDGLQRWLI